MDVLINKEGLAIRLSSIGLEVQDVIDESPVITTNFRTIQGRHGRVNAGATYTEKKIAVVGKVVSPSMQAYEAMRDEVHGLVVDADPFYLTKMLPVHEDLYRFEVPGENTGEIDWQGVEHEAYKYRWHVITNGPIEWNFLGRSARGLLAEFVMHFVTATLPFGETIPVRRRVTNNIVYNGTANNSQLERPWTVELTATQQQPGTFNLKIGNRQYIRTSGTPIQAGQKLIISGVSTLLNFVNITHQTNYQHFELRPGNNPITTNFVGTIDVNDFVELYK